MIDIVEHQMVRFEGQDCLIRLIEGDQILLDFYSGSLRWVSHDDLLEENPDLVVSE